MQEAFFNQKINHLDDEVNGLKSITRNFSATNQAQKQAINEYIDCNIQLRASMLLLEADIHTLKKENSQFIEMIKSLNVDKNNLQNKFDEINNSNKEVDIIDGA